MPYLLDKTGCRKTKVGFTNLREQRFDRLLVKSLIAFDPTTIANAFWKCVCDCGRELTAATRDLISQKVTACRNCMNYHSFSPDEILVVVEKNDLVPVGEEVINRGGSGLRLSVEYRGGIILIERRLVRSTGLNF